MNCSLPKSANAFGKAAVNTLCRAAVNTLCRAAVNTLCRAAKHPVFKTAVTLIVLASISKAALQLADQATFQVLSVAFPLAVGLATFYRAVNPIGWALVLRGMGYRVEPVAATEVWLRAESRRWLPGGIWGYASRAAQSQNLGVPVKQASASMLIELVLTVFAAAAVGLAGLSIYRHEFADVIREATKSIPATTSTWVAIVGIAVVAVSVSLGLLRKKIAKRYASISEKKQQLAGLRSGLGRFTSAWLYLIAMAILNAGVNQVLLKTFDFDHEVPFAAMVGATAIAWVVGLLAFFAPGGLMVREAALATLLLPWLPYPVGLALAVQSRFAQVIAEVICMLPLCIPGHRTVSIEES